MQEEKMIVINMAWDIFLELPFWKRWKVIKYYRSNNWDVTGEWENCIQQARKMIDDGLTILGEDIKY